MMAVSRRWSVIGFALVAALAALMNVSTVSSAATQPPPNCGGPVDNPHHCFVMAEQQWSSPTIDGMGASFTEPGTLPGVKSTGNSYSIGQLWLDSTTSVYEKVIEFGWLVDPAVYHDHFPHLFLDLRWVGIFGPVKAPCFEGIPGNLACPNGTYVQLSATYHPGMAVGGALNHGHVRSGFYHVGYYQGWWWVQYGNQWMGRVDASWWSIGGFAKANHAMWWGEVASDNNSCTPMGTGIYATKSGAAKIAGMFYEKPNDGAFTAAANIASITDPRYWGSSITNVNKTFDSFSYGGPHGSPSHPCKG
jgi:Neprosin